MKKNKNKIIEVIKNNIMFVILFIVFIMACLVVWKRKHENPELSHAPLHLSPSVNRAQPPVTLQNDMRALTNRIQLLEQKSQNPVVSSSKLELIEILKGVLDELIPIDMLKAYLSRIPEPWSQAFLASIAPVNQILSYQKLNNLLITPVPAPAPAQPTLPPEQLPFWQDIKTKIKSFIHIRKTDKYRPKKDIHKALRDHDMVTAVAAYERLPEPEKQGLSAWFKAVQDRLILENTLKQLLKDLAQGNP